MAIAHDFDYARPTSLAEVLELLKAHGEKARILAGGTDLIVNIKESMVAPAILIDIKDIAELREIRIEADQISIGASVTFTELLESPLMKERFPMLWDAAATVASSGIRNRATLAGNICTAVPSLDSAPPLLCHDALVHCVSAEGSRAIPITEWFLAPRKTSLLPHEVVTKITLPLPQKDSTGIYLKLGRYNGEDLAQAGWGFWISARHQYRLAHCALGPIPARARAIEAVLNGSALTEDLIRQAVALVESEIRPITDIRSGKEYRVHISKVMLKRGLIAAQDRLQGKSIEPKALLGGFA
jgi:CO/xanthine dehydrogenase FAD-binding subunit